MHAARLADSHPISKRPEFASPGRSGRTACKLVRYWDALERIRTHDSNLTGLGRVVRLLQSLRSHELFSMLKLLAAFLGFLGCHAISPCLLDCPRERSPHYMQYPCQRKQLTRSLLSAFDCSWLGRIQMTAAIRGVEYFNLSLKYSILLAGFNNFSMRLSPD